MKRISQMGVTLGVAFTAAAVQAQEAPRTPVLHGDEESYWKPESVDAVIALRRCPETTACGEIRWYNPNDRRVTQNFGDRSLPGGTPQNFCGFSPRMRFREINANKWEGWMHVRGMGITVNMTIKAIDENTIELTGYKKPIPKFVKAEKDVWHRVEANDPRYPKCKK